MACTEIEDRSALGQLNDPKLKIKPSKIYYTTVKDVGLEKKWKDKSVLSLDDIKDLRKVLKENATKEKKIYLHEIIGGSNVIIPNLVIPERNPELEKRLAVLRNQIDEKEYQRMTRNVNTTRPYTSIKEDSISHQLKQMNSGMIAVLQFVISLAAAFLFGFSGIQIFVGPMDLAVRLLLGIASAVIVGIAELYVLVVLIDSRESKETDNERKTK